ncbi:MAG: hypothetical protein RML36_16085 [Anaerolineae bacterium]|nr:hypothetical protein [Anaerolineae bacterium]MDW8100993.1 hypothetical protein [Anaerolineae bacterium]
MGLRSPLIFNVLLSAVLFLAAFSTNQIAEAAAPGCFNLIVNGDFESIGGWQINVSPATPDYVPAPNRSGVAMRLGITEVPNRFAYSSIMQTVTIPPDAVSAKLHWDFFAIAEGPMDHDRQEVIVLDSVTRQTREIIWRVRRDDRTWLTAVADMLDYRGQTITLYFNVLNDGAGAADQTTAMYLDNVRLDVCTSVTPTPTATPSPTPTPLVTFTPSPTFTPFPPTTLTPTPTSTPPPLVTLTPTPTATPSPTPTFTPFPPATLTPTPTSTPPPPVTLTPTPTFTSIPGDCYELLDNGGFETDATWQLLPTRLWPTYAGSPNPVHSGLRSVMLGNRPLPDAVSYSSIRQETVIPLDAQTAFIRFWYWAQSDDTDGGDRQQLSLLDPVTYVRIRDLWRPSPLRNEQSWRLEEIDLTPYRGQDILVYFNVYNDGDGKRTVLFLDDVTLQACYTLPTDTPAPTVTGASFSPPLPTETPTPPLHNPMAPASEEEETNAAFTEAVPSMATPVIALANDASNSTSRPYLLVGTGVLLAFGIVMLIAFIAWWLRARNAVHL